MKAGTRRAFARHLMDILGYALEGRIIHEGLVESGKASFNDTLRLYYKFHGKGNKVWT